MKEVIAEHPQAPLLKMVFADENEQSQEGDSDNQWNKKPSVPICPGTTDNQGVRSEINDTSCCEIARDQFLSNRFYTEKIKRP